MKKTFTLIELMVTISIIGVLLLVAVPTYEREVLKGRFDEAVVGIKSIILAMEEYKIETGYYYPHGFITENTVMYNGDETARKIKVDLTKYKNFLYGIETNNAGDEYIIHAVLRKENSWDNNKCNISSSSDKKCVQSTQDEDTWVSNYNTDISHHFITYSYPNSGVANVNGIDYTNIYVGD